MHIMQLRMLFLTFGLGLVGFYSQAGEILEVKGKSRPIVGGLTKTNDTGGGVYPLFDKLKWGMPEGVEKSIDSKVVQGSVIKSKTLRNITDIAKETEGFQNYYDKKLEAEGWSVENSLFADGPGSSEWGFKKGNRYIVLSYTSVPENDKPDEIFSCPCHVTFAVFSGTIN